MIDIQNISSTIPLRGSIQNCLELVRSRPKCNVGFCATAWNISKDLGADIVTLS